MTKDEIANAIVEYRKEFQADFPGEDALKVASLYCNHVLQSKMQKLLEKWFAFREPLDLIAILGFIHEQAKRAEGEKGPGRPRKPRGNGSAVRHDAAVASPE